MDASEAARRWAERWADGWRRRDAASIGALYAEDCEHHSTPFRPAYQGRSGLLDYVGGAFEDEFDADPTFGAPVVQGDQAVVEYWCTLTEAGEPVTIAGCSFLRFAPDGLVTDQRDYWHQLDGHRPPWPGWGR